jgi:hypothetical protein
MSQVGHSADSGQTRKMTHKCGRCKKQVTKSDRGLKCEYCGAWFHIECESVTSDQQDKMEEKVDKLTTRVEEIDNIKGNHKERVS